MYLDFKKIFSVLSLIALGVAIGIFSIKAIDRFKAPKQTVSVVGAGEVDAVTDQATITIQVINTADTYEKAQEENKKDVEALKSELIKLGIPESRITQSSYSPPIIRNIPDINYQEGSVNKMMPTYRPETNPAVTTNLTLVLDPIKNIEKVYDIVSKNTNAQITNSYYSLKNRKQWETKAKEEALKDARNQIESVAKINRLRVGKLVTLEDANNPKPYPMPLKAFDSGSGVTNIEDQSQPIEKSSMSQQNTGNVFYSEQTVKITASYNAQYELY
ncbi:SIMPL domain-containing protein [Candidatus Roizmanbacteria bacterium]|nr:SIMPL domain-containing protein [Candidatus Roizmanbacteria bacterium]